MLIWDNFKSFKYKPKLLENAAGDGANGTNFKKCNNCCPIKTFK